MHVIMDLKAGMLPADQDPAEGAAMIISIFYKEAADVAACLNDGRILKFNKAILCCATQSKVLYQIFFGPLKEVEIKIDDIDYETFKLFLDCAMKYQQLNFKNAFKIFPVVHKYQCDPLMDKCIKSLAPTIMDDKVCDLLNMATFYYSKKLIQNTMEFIFENNVYEFLENEELCHPLEPEAMKAILEYVSIDDGILMMVAKWGKNYVQKNDLNFHNVRDFYEKYDLLQFFQLQYFATTGAISEFCLSEEGKDIFSFQEVLLHLHNTIDLCHGKSKWLNVKKNTTITENIDPDINSRIYMISEIKRNTAKCSIIKAPESSHASSSSVNAKEVHEEEETEDEEVEKEEIDEIENMGNRSVISCTIDFIATDRTGEEVSVWQKTAQFSYQDLEADLKDQFLTHYETSGCNEDFESIEINWTFSENCRILLVNNERSKYSDYRTMYFTKSILPYFY